MTILQVSMCLHLLGLHGTSKYVTFSILKSVSFPLSATDLGFTFHWKLRDIQMNYSAQKFSQYAYYTIS